MSTFTFTITVYDTASANVTLALVQDSVNLELWYIYVKQVVLMSTLSTTTSTGASNGRAYQMKITQPSQTGYTPSGITIIPLTQSLLTASGTGAFDGTYTYVIPASGSPPAAPANSYLIGTQIVQLNSTTVVPTFVLQTNTTAAPTMTNVVEAGISPVAYTFEISPGVDKIVDVKTVAPTDPSLQNGITPVLYSKFGSTVSGQVYIGQDGYTVVQETSAGQYVTSGNDFTLYLPFTANANQYVETAPSITIPFQLVGLLNLGLSTTVPSSQGTGAAISANAYRSTEIDYYAFFPYNLTNVTVAVDTIQKAISSNSTVSIYAGQSTTFNSFTYQGITYIVTTKTISSKNYVFFQVQPGLSVPAGQTSSIYDIRLRIVPATTTFSATPSAQ